WATTLRPRDDRCCSGTQRAGLGRRPSSDRAHAVGKGRRQWKLCQSILRDHGGVGGRREVSLAATGDWTACSRRISGAELWRTKAAALLGPAPRRSALRKNRQFARTERLCRNCQVKIQNGTGGSRETSTDGPGPRPGRSDVGERGRESINFFAELKRRNVYKVAVAYIVAGWALSQGIAQVFPVFDVPNWVIRSIVVLIIVGLPIALVLAGIFELTPQGIKRTETADAMPAATRKKKYVWIYVVVIGSILSIGLFMLGRYGFRDKTLSSNEVLAKSVAVLPFGNLSRDPDNEYF